MRDSFDIAEELEEAEGETEGEAEVGLVTGIVGSGEGIMVAVLVQSMSSLLATFMGSSEVSFFMSGVRVPCTLR